MCSCFISASRQSLHCIFSPLHFLSSALVWRRRQTGQVKKTLTVLTAISSLEQNVHAHRNKLRYTLI